ncbi:hypothetical protein N752_30015 [Desulforamulus aquiferis]|nr:hypothetical protein [Desulforamulus aquiferis]RYD01539.1 hypothetical protein N752_30015 [Desulforamulus aquiferis]
MREKIIGVLILTFLILILLLSIMNGSIYLGENGVYPIFSPRSLVIIVSFAIIIGLIINGLLVRSLLQLTEKEADFKAQAAYSESMEELFGQSSHSVTILTTMSNQYMGC